MGLEALKRLEHQAGLGWDLSQRFFHPPGLPEESSAAQQDVLWGSNPAVPVPRPAPAAGAFPVLPPRGCLTARAPLPFPCPSPAQNWKGLSLFGGIISSFLFPRGAASTVADASEPDRAGGALSLPVLGLSPLPHFSFPSSSSCFCSGSRSRASGAVPSWAVPPVPRAPNPALGSAQRARELLC